MYGAWTKRLCGIALSVLLCFTAAGAADVSGTRSLIPVGHTVGIKLFSRGVMVVKLPESGTPARNCGLRAGDVIVQCGGTAVTSTEQFQELLQQEGPADLRVSRNGGEMTLRVEPERNAEGVCQIGAWIRDSMAGIGTVTYYDPVNGTFGALGHGVTDVDTALLMPFQDGSILPSTVKAVKRGERGQAGELRGDFDLSRDLGELFANTDRGVFGTIRKDGAGTVSGTADHPPEGVQPSPEEVELSPEGVQPTAEGAQPSPEGAETVKPLPGREKLSSEAVNLSPEKSELALGEPIPIGEPTAGRAQILSNVRGDEVSAYGIEILKVLPDSPDGRDMVIAVTDPALTAITGGIVQGMSGSPILQDGKLVGAVTHVLLQDPEKGYGITIAHMLEAA